MSIRVDTLADNEVHWRKVVVHRLDAAGSPIKEENGVRAREYRYIEDVKTGELYWDESASVIAMKCAGIVLGLPTYLLTYAAWNMIKLPLNITAIINSTLDELSQNWGSGQLKEGARVLCEGFFTQLPARMFPHIWNVVKSPLLAISLGSAAIYGMVDPFCGRKMIAHIEHAWQNNISYKYDLRKIKTADTGNIWFNFINDCHVSKAFYLAWCFQPRGNIKDSTKFQVLRSESIAP
jgi:hypothetical protein